MLLYNYWNVQSNEWYYPQRHDWFLYETYGNPVFEHEGISYYRQRVIGENPNFFTGTDAYKPNGYEYNFH